MTWKEFIERIEMLGVKPDDELLYIDVQGGESLLVEGPGNKIEITSGSTEEDRREE